MASAAEDVSATTGPPRFGPWRREMRAFLELLALTGIAVAQPTFEILKTNAEIFVSRSSTRIEVIGLALVFVLVPPISLWVIEVIAGLVIPTVRRWVHAVLCAAVFGTIAVEVLKKQTDLGSTLLVVLALALAVLGGGLVWRSEVVRLWLRYLAIAPVIFAVLFLFFSPVTTAVFESDPGVADASVGRPARVVMVVFDEFPTMSLLDGNGRIDAALYPNFAALAGDSTWYRNETTVSPSTETAVPAILTGDLPDDANPIAVAASEPKNLFTLLGGTYEMNVHEGFTAFCPATLCAASRTTAARAHLGFRGLAFDTYRLWRDFASPERQPETVSLSGGDLLGDPDPLRTGGRFVSSLEPTDQPRLDFLHVLLPHEAWHYLPSGQDYEQFGLPRGLDLDTWATEWTAELGRERHLLQVRATDRLLGRIVAKLKRIGAYDESLLVVGADHGVAFTRGNPLRGVSQRNSSQIVWTPLFIKTPGGQPSAIDDEPARTIDILPTIADHLDVKIPWEVDGHTLLEPRRMNQPVKVFDWVRNWIKPPPGRRFITLDGPAGFAAAMKGQASSASGDPELALYKVGPFGDLLGQPMGPLITGEPRSSGTIEGAGGRVRTAGVRAPWAYVQGTIKGAEPDTPVAITVNGVVAGFSATWRDPAVPESLSYWSVVAPQMFHDGRNEIRIFLIRGSSSAPALEPVLTGG